MSAKIVYTSNIDDRRLFISNLLDNACPTSRKWNATQGLLFLFVIASLVTLYLASTARLPHNNNLEVWLEDGGALIGTLFFAFMFGKVTVIIAKRNEVIADFKEHQENVIYREKGEYPILQTSKAQRVWNTFIFHLKHFAISHAHHVRSNVFREVNGCKFIAPSINCGRKEDIPKYVDPQRVSKTFAEEAQKDKTFISPTYTLGPFNGGICLGMSLTFARDYFETGDVRVTAEKFTKGGSEEAVVIQAKSDKLFTENRFCFHLNGSDYSLVTESPYSKEKFFKAKVRLANLSYKSHQTNLNYDQALTQIAKLNEGVYQIGFPVFSGTTSDGAHSILFIKEKGSCALFDPNYGTGSIDPSKGADLVKAFFVHYGTYQLVNTEQGPITITALDKL